MSTQFTNRQWRLPNNENKDKQSNYSMDFDSASSDYIDLGNITELNNLSAISTSSWFKTSNVSNAPIILNGGSSSTNRFYLQLLNSTTIRYVIGSSVENITVSNIADGNWHHISTVQNGTSLDIYLDGAKQNTSTITVVSPSTNIGDNFKIGRYFLSAANYFDGQIDAVSIYNYALSASQITTLYGSSSTGIGNPMSLSPKPVAYYQLGDKSAFNGANYLVPNIAAQEDDGDIAVSYSPYALDFDAASSDYIDCGTGLGNSLGTVTSLVVSLWVKAPSTSINDFVFYIGDLSNNYGALSIHIVSNKLRVRLNNNAGNFYLDFTSNDWNNIVFVYDGSNQSNSLIYINGQLQTVQFSNLFPSSLNLSGLKTIIGTGYSTAYSFDGQISNVSIWNAGLTSAQVTEVYNEGVPSNLNNHSAYSNLVSWWQLGSNSSFNTNWTVLDEVTASGNNGTSVNMGEDAIVDGVGSYANGLSSGMGGDEVVGDAPYSTANALSVNMDVEDRVTDTPS